MLHDQSPEEVAAAAEAIAPAVPLSIEDAVQRPDPNTEPEPADLGEDGPGAQPQAVRDFSGIHWPSKEKAPDYGWIAGVASHDEFILTADTLEALFKLNRYQPTRETSIIAFGLRGATLASGHEAISANTINMKVATPNHQNFRCVIGVLEHGTGRISAFSGSTVPCRKAVWGSKNGGEASNMLPTGMYTYYIWRHKALSPALRLARGAADVESGADATVLRNSADLMLDTSDLFDLSAPLDNVHCSYFLSENTDLGAEFSSWGCLTVRGGKTPTEQWKKFQEILTKVGLKSRVDLMLTTGKEAAIVAGNSNDADALEETLGSLRQGSRGHEVVHVQKELGLAGNGFWGPLTADRFTGRQRALNKAAGNGEVADGIYGRSADALTGWGVFQTADV